VRSVIRVSYICGGLIAILVLANYTRRSFQAKPVEVIVFSIIGHRPFSDSISTIWPNGSHAEPLLRPKQDKSYLGASGNSLTVRLVVAVHENKDLIHSENHLYLYNPRSGAWQRLLTLDGEEGYGVISPDDSHVVLEFEPKTIAGERPGEGRLWLVDLISG
jgi:hypothetical protein